MHWENYTNYSLLLNEFLMQRSASLTLKGKFYRTCVQKVLLYDGETWPMKLKEMNRLKRAE